MNIPSRMSDESKPGSLTVKRAFAPSAAPTWPHRAANVRPAYQNTSDAMDIAVKALQLAASNARMEGAPPALIEKLTSQAARLSAVRLEVMKGNPA
nr:MAG TPA: hypothetical protein [Caudoviricetes sp.]